jgi:cobalt-precorrin-5B (C1)-methyltransferase
MIGKLSKMADGKMQTHAAGSEVNMGLLGDLAAELGAGPEVCNEIRKANTARQALEICKASGYEELTSVVCRKVVEHCTRYAGSSLRVQAYLVDFEGAVLGQYPPANYTEEATA